jgi:hypothetical protein
VPDTNEPLQIYVVIDRQFSLEDSDRSNNIASSFVLAPDLTVALEAPDDALGCPHDLASDAQCVRLFPDGTGESATVTVSAGGHVYTVAINPATSQVVLTAGLPAD